MKFQFNSVAQSCLTLGDPMDCGPPASSVQGILQARILEWVANDDQKDGKEKKKKINIKLQSPKEPV